jgi:hypothetical protein
MTRQMFVWSLDPYVRPSQHVALTSNGNLVAVIDRFALATQAERDVLQARLS